MACYYDDFELLDSYIELNHGLLVKNRFNNTPLHIAVQHSSSQFCKKLIDLGKNMILMLEIN